MSRKAILYGMQLAKESGAKVTGLTVTEPYQAAGMDAVFVPVDLGDCAEAVCRSCRRRRSSR